MHGGAGPLPRPGFDDTAHRTALLAALEAGWRAIGDGCVAAVQAAVEVLEDAPEFNAGRGSVLTSAGSVEMDAAIAAGEGARAGAVGCVRRVRHPVALARVVMERTPHVLLVGGGAEALAEEHDLELLKPAWFVTARERERLERAAGETVGAVARDAAGSLAAATSTGGMRGQLPGRVGDSPLLGAGTWADERCAISVTGHGEAVIRAVAGYEAARRVADGAALTDAADIVLRDRVAAFGGSAGLIALGTEGEPVMPFTTGAMWRGWRVGGAAPQTAVA